MPRIVALSDTHGMHQEVKIPDGDILIHAGDITGRGSLQEIIMFNNWIKELPHPWKIVIAGNHDAALSTDSLLAKSFLTGCVYLENKGSVIENIYNIYGSPITLKFMDWYFMVDRDKIKRYWDKIPNPTDILITHSPCYGILDELPLKGHLGCEELAKRVKQVKPKLHIFGHIHGAYGVTKIDDTIYVNCSICDEEYIPVNKPIVIDI